MPQHTKDIAFLRSNYIAHRGYHNEEFPENTMGAFKRGLEEGFSLEMDLQVTKDNKLVVFHDDEMERLTGVKGRINDFTYDELLKMRILGSTQTIPLFQEVLDLVQGKVPLIVELKTYKPSNQIMCELTVDHLKNYNGKFIVMCFDPYVLKTIRELNPDIIRGQLICRQDKKYIKNPLVRWFINTLKINMISKPDFMDSDKVFIPKQLRRLKKKMPVICWTVQSKEEQIEAEKFFDQITFENFDPR